MIEMSPLPSANQPARQDDRRRREVGLALANALRLGLSLVATWGIALVTRLYIPRFLGPERFGILNFTEAFATTAFVAMGLGVDQYVRKEVAVRPERASDFVGGIVGLRLVLVLFVFACMELVLRGTHRDSQVRVLVYVYGVAQFFIVGGNTSAGLLQATGRVSGISILSVVVKFAWALSIFAAIFFRLGLWAFAVSVAVSEGIRAVALFWLARKHLGFSMRLDFKATWAVLTSSLPFLISSLATTIYDKIGTNLLAFKTSDREVGWYGAASGLSGMTLMLAPLVSWILTPLFARAAAESQEEFFFMLRRSLEFILALSVPLSLMMFLGADLWISILFGPAFGPAGETLEVLAIATVLMYLSIVAFNALAVLNDTWRMSLVFVGGMVVNPICNLILIDRVVSSGAVGQGGVACATSTLVTEVAIAVPLMVLMGRRSFDRQLLSNVGKSVGAALLVYVLDRMVLERFGHWRIAADGILYVLFVLLSGAVDVKGMRRMLSASRGAGHAT